MPKSKSTKDHKTRLAKYKANKKKEQEFFKKKMIDNYMKMQQAQLAETESHTSTEEVMGPEIDIDELNQIDSIETEENFDLSNFNFDQNMEEANISLETGQISEAEIIETKDIDNQ